MATLNYTARLQNLQNRRYDLELNESATTRAFSDKSIPENVRYLVESMLPIDQKYNEKTKTAANNVQKHLQNGFNLHFNRVYKTQGSILTGTNIKVHSDFDLLTIIDRYHYPEGQPTNPYRDSNPKEDIQELWDQAVAILKGIYDEVDDSGEKSIAVFNKSLKRKVDIVPCYWYHSNKYDETQDEYYKGIYLYDFKLKIKTKKDYPFATIHQVNAKGDNTTDGSRRGIRLLKTLKADNESIGLSSFHLTSLVHGIQNTDIMYNKGSEMSIARAMSSTIKRLIDDPIYRKSIKCPISIETPFEKDEVVAELKKLKEDLDTLIEDASKEIIHSSAVQKTLLTY